jgi:hypothetical protein
MTETANFGLPLVQAAQAQKHVTVNEALARLDALGQLVIQSRSVTVPPPTQSEGVVYAVPAAAVNAWAGQGGKLAILANGGWVFASPVKGWRGWIADEGQPALYDGTAWRGGALALGPSGAGVFVRVLELDHAIGAGASSETVQALPANVLLFAVSARVVAAITGSLASWRLGVDGAEDRFGSALGTGLGAFGRGLLGAPMALYQPQTLLLTAEGGDFAGGTVRLAAHYAEFSLPGV